MYCVRHGLSSSYSNEFMNVRPENRFIEACQDLYCYTTIRRPQRSEGTRIAFDYMSPGRLSGLLAQVAVR